MPADSGWISSFEESVMDNKLYIRRADVTACFLPISWNEYFNLLNLICARLLHFSIIHRIDYCNSRLLSQVRCLILRSISGSSLYETTMFLECGILIFEFSNLIVSRVFCIEGKSSKIVPFFVLFSI